MNNPDASLMTIFATPFGGMNLDVSAATNTELLALFEERATPQHHDPRLAADALCFRSRDDLLDWPDAPIQQIKRHILGGLVGIVAAANLYTESQFDELQMQARAWFSLIRPDGSIPVTSYVGTSWCAIYCVAAPALLPGRNDNGLLRLYESRLATSFIDASTWRLRAPFAHGHFNWRPVAGNLAVFPATIPHEIGLLRAESSLALITVRARFATPGQQGMPAW